MSDPVPASEPHFHPQLTYLCSVYVKLGAHLGPIPLLDGTKRSVEPITGGSFAGPGFNATIDGGCASPVLIPSGKGDGSRTQVPYIYLYGHTDAGDAFYIEETGMGTGKAQTTRIQLYVGGKYAHLQNAYIIGQPVPNADSSAVTVDCFCLPLPDNS